MKKKLRLLLLLLLLSALFPAQAYGEQRYSVQREGLSFSLPESYVMISADSDPDDPNMHFFNSDGEEQLARMEEMGEFFWALDQESAMWVFGSTWEGEQSLNYLSADDNELISRHGPYGLEEYGIQMVGEPEIYKTDEAKFVRTLTRKEDSYFLMEYCTQFGRQVYSIYFINGIPFNSLQMRDQEFIIDSFEFGSAGLSGSRGAKIGVYVFAILLFPLPVLVYRFAIRRSQPEENVALVFSLLWSLAAFLVPLLFMDLKTLLLPWVFLALWTVFGAFLLRARKPQPVQGEQPARPAPPQAVREAPPPTAPPEPAGRIFFCPRCGAALEADSLFCHNCGERL